MLGHLAAFHLAQVLAIDTYEAGELVLAEAAGSPPLGDPPPYLSRDSLS